MLCDMGSTVTRREEVPSSLGRQACAGVRVRGGARVRACAGPAIHINRLARPPSGHFPKIFRKNLDSTYNTCCIYRTYNTYRTYSIMALKYANSPEAVQAALEQLPRKAEPKSEPIEKPKPIREIVKADTRFRSSKKQRVTIWLDNDVVERFRQESGWHPRINAALRKHLGI